MNSAYMILILIFFPFLAGLVGYGIGLKNESYRDIFVIACGVLECLVMAVFAYSLITTMEGETFASVFLPGICGMGLHFEIDGFRAVYGIIAGLMWMMTLILSREYFMSHDHRNRFYFYMLWTLGATVAVFFSANLYTTFIFFEIMSFTSYAWVAQEENEASLKAAGTYLAVAVIGGLVMLMGLFLVYHELGTLEMAQLSQALMSEGGRTPVIYAAGVCMLFGFGAKAGAFPLHIWLPKAHPVAPAPASALLSGILTKTGIFGILVITTNLFCHDPAWAGMILVIGELTMFGGALLAVFSIDLKRTLACSSMSQVGFILVGVGMQGLLGDENALAIHGTMLHMINHSLIKLVLFMVAGVVYMNAHALDLNKIKGFGRKKPLLKVIFLVGALSIAGIPMFSGYVSKTLLHESIVEYGGGLAMSAAEWIFLFSGGLTLAYMTKLFLCIFVETNDEEDRQLKYDNMKQYMNPASTFALTASAVILFVWGIAPHVTMDKVAELGQSFMGLMEEEGHVVAYFSLTNLSGAVISICIGMAVYFGFIRTLLRRKEEGACVYINAWPKWLDLEEILYRPLLMTVLPIFCGVIFRVFDSILDILVVLLRKSFLADNPLPYERPEGTFFSELIGLLRNTIQRIANKTWNHNHPTNIDYLHLEAVKAKERNENFRIIQRSLSFGLMLFGVGLMLVLIYLVFL